MPTIHRELGFGFVIYVDDHRPAHVHVTGRGTAKITLEPAVTLVQRRNLSNADARRLLDVVEARRSMMIEAWNRIHG